MEEARTLKVVCPHSLGSNCSKRRFIEVSSDACIPCPVCGYGVGVHLHGVNLNTPEVCGNQGNATIVFWGECGHCWAMVFSGHKGEVFIENVVILGSVEDLVGVAMLVNDHSV